MKNLMNFSPLNPKDGLIPESIYKMDYPEFLEKYHLLSSGIEFYPRGEMDMLEKDIISFFD